MTLGKRLLLHSARDPAAAGLSKITADWSCLVHTCSSPDELRGRIDRLERQVRDLENRLWR